MQEYILRLIAEGENHSDALELRVEGNVPKVDDIFTINKEYPACIVTYRVTGVSHKLDMPKLPLPRYKSQTIVSVLRETSKQFPQGR
jgi:hypothetical protein